MLELMFTAGQVAAAMLVIYGGVLSIGTAMPVQRKSRALNPALEDDALLLKHIQNDA
jgi:hypothetical protein